METIHNYLETMFSALPNTDEVYRAKDELSAMMEDKFHALLEEGMAEEEAVAKVISEFGSLDEIADDLGIREAVVGVDEKKQRRITEPETAEYLKDSGKAVRRRACGVGLIVAGGSLMPLVRLVADYLYGGAYYPVQLVEAAGAMGMFLCIAFGVGMIIVSTSGKQKWAFLSHENCQLDYPALSAVDSRYRAEQEKLSMRLATGVGLCILSILPIFLFSGHFRGGIFGQASQAAFLIVGACGIVLILCTIGRKRAFERLLGLNGRDTVGGNQFLSQKRLRFDEPMIEEALSVYWQTVLCLYLCWSFLTFSWTRTWVLWPVAALIHRLLVNLFGKEEF